MLSYRLLVFFFLSYLFESYSERRERRERMNENENLVSAGSLPPGRISRELDEKVEQPGLGSARVWNAGIPGSEVTCWSTVLARNSSMMSRKGRERDGAFGTHWILERSRGCLCGVGWRRDAGRQQRQVAVLPTGACVCSSHRVPLH